MFGWIFETQYCMNKLGCNPTEGMFKGMLVEKQWWLLWPLLVADINTTGNNCIMELLSWHQNKIVYLNNYCPPPPYPPSLPILPYFNLLSAGVLNRTKVNEALYPVMGLGSLIHQKEGFKSKVANIIIGFVVDRAICNLGCGNLYLLKMLLIACWM